MKKGELWPSYLLWRPNGKNQVKTLIHLFSFCIFVSSHQCGSNMIMLSYWCMDDNASSVVFHQWQWSKPWFRAKTRRSFSVWREGSGGLTVVQQHRNMRQERAYTWHTASWLLFVIFMWDKEATRGSTEERSNDPAMALTSAGSL